MKKFLFSLMAILLAIGVVGAGAMAIFSDVEKVEVGDISAGTLDLTVGGENPCTEHITISNIAPGYSELVQLWLANTGSLDGELSVEISTITNNDNGLTEPESVVDSTAGDGEGELGEYLKAKAAWYDDPSTTTAFANQILNDIGGRTFTTSGNFALLEAGETQSLKMVLELPEGTGNIVQSDSVEFDIIFHLDQTP